MRTVAPEHPLWVVRIVTVAALVLAGVVGTSCGTDSGEGGAEQPTFDYVIPAGTGDRIDAGEPLVILPSELVANLDETIQIVNHDDRAHLVGPWFVGAGETLRQRFNVAGVFAGGCSVHPSGEFTVTVNA
ncbi:MAG: hypothetical protein ABJH68_15740 [Ilumatobacter sp.]|uniref:cupredoxin domain-containing protein n=1 Tax=Ilumatobacter sp. TaxID=1967498 RepID=UPI003299F979